MDDAGYKLSVARIYATKPTIMPYFAAALFSFPMRETKECPTMAMSKKGVIYYNPQFVQDLSVAELATVLVHETLHFIRDHAGRGENQDIKDQSLAYIWNIACDLEINDDLKAANMSFPEKYPGVTPDKYKLKPNLIAETYYRQLLEKAEKVLMQPNLMAGDCGGVAGNPGDWEDAEVEAELGRSDLAAEIVRQQAAQAIRKEAQEKGRGTLPESLVRWAEERLGTSKIPWQKLLKSAIRRAADWARGKVSYTFKRASRRQSAIGFGSGRPVLPGMRRPLPHVWGVVDTSGSMSSDDLGDAMREIKAVLNEVGKGLSFLSCDAEVSGVTPIASFEEAKKLLKGGGGTSFVPIFEAYKNASKKPSIIIIMTDGGGDAPETPPSGAAVIWCLIGEHHQRPFQTNDYSKPITWGELIEVGSNTQET